ncbi:hypothetical protein [Actinomadura livida]|uniref:DUF885 domain-containing protein n=1 Tax=Actinomadura livida TaxID=79909 RepID=A0A7W7I889_9ACTN|nr:MULTISPECIES: hypothetical protein [Actinomadura]MBB4772229.1 hypothetical protein [Actinomadura catellatispora]GGU27805.1 hypothetical protein GCM10010208_60840 [Actinomadura livida]
MMESEEWLRSFADLALRVDRQAGGPNTSGLTLIYRGPDEWREQVNQEAPRPPGRLVGDAERLLDDPPFERSRAAYLSGQVRALRAVARRLDGAAQTLPEYVRECLGIDPEWVPESVFATAHEELDAALPPGPGALADRLAAWRAAHRLDSLDRLPELVGLAVEETRARTARIVPLPDGEVVGCRVVSGVPFHAAGDHEGGLASTIHINRDIPFNLADLLYVVAHEGHPGHIAESLLKETHLADRPEQRVRFLLSPQGVISEGLGLVAEELVFPGDEAQEWLAEHVLPDARGLGDLAAIHRAMNAMWGAWPNASLMAAEGRPQEEIRAYLSRWALLREEELAAAMPLIAVPGGNPYLFAYYHGWRLVRAWLDGPGRRERARRLLTEQLLPADLTA